MKQWSAEVNDAIREAFAEGLTWSHAYKKLKAGTLTAELGPLAMPERTFSAKWRKAKREQQLARTGSAYEGPTFLDWIGLALARRDAGMGPGSVPESAGLSASHARELLAMEGTSKAGGPRIADQIEEKEAAANGGRIGGVQ